MKCPLFVPGIASILPIIDQRRHQRSSIAIVIDGYGGAEGLLALNDVLSDVVGEIDDPHQNEGRFETIGGFVLDQLGSIPSPADGFTWNGFRFEVMDMDGIRIDKVLVSGIGPDDPDNNRE